MLGLVNKAVSGNFSKHDVVFGVGDVVLVEFLSSVGSRRVRKFIGVCIYKRKLLGGSSFCCLRTVRNGLGVELSFFENSGNILNLSVLARKYVHTSKSRCYRLRDAKLKIVGVFS